MDSEQKNYKLYRIHHITSILNYDQPDLTQWREKQNKNRPFHKTKFMCIIITTIILLLKYRRFFSSLFWQYCIAQRD